MLIKTIICNNLGTIEMEENHLHFYSYSCEDEYAEISDVDYLNKLRDALISYQKGSLNTKAIWELNEELSEILTWESIGDVLKWLLERETLDILNKAKELKWI